MKNSAEILAKQASAPTNSARRRGFSRRIEALALAGLLAASAGACSSAGGSASGVGGGAGGNTGVGGAADVPTITSDMFGAFDNAFMITPCGTPVTQGYDCPNRPIGAVNCPTTQWAGNTTAEATGNSYTETFTVTATDPAKIYAITVRVRGQAEGRTYVNGVRNATTATDPSAVVSDLLYTGGQPGSTRVDYNVFELRITPPDGTAIDGEPLYYAFNAVDAQHEGQHMNYQVDETFTMRVKSGFTLNLSSHDSNCIAIQNCGPQGTPYGYSTADQCQQHAAAGPQPTVPGVTLPTDFRGQTLANGGAQPFQTQFLNFKVMSIVAE
jgi:hypothetical protein